MLKFERMSASMPLRCCVMFGARWLLREVSEERLAAVIPERAGTRPLTRPSFREPIPFLGGMAIRLGSHLAILALIIPWVPINDPALLIK